MPTLAPTVLHALATIRYAVRTCQSPQLGILYYALLSLAGDALAGVSTITVYGGNVDVGHSSEVSQLVSDDRHSSSRVADRWITPQDAAARLGHSERWLRRRRLKPPYCAFCIPGDSGRGYRVSLRDLEAHMERERKRAARE